MSGLLEDPVALVDGDSGRWEVATDASKYVLDLDRMTGTRLPGKGDVPLGESTGDVFVTILDMDGEEWPLQSIIHCRVGDPMLLAYLDRNGQAQPRRSTTVRSIRAMA